MLDDVEAACGLVDTMLSATSAGLYRLSEMLDTVLDAKNLLAKNLRSGLHSKPPANAVLPGNTLSGKSMTAEGLKIAARKLYYMHTPSTSTPNPVSTFSRTCLAFARIHVRHVAYSNQALLLRDISAGDPTATTTGCHVLNHALAHPPTLAGVLSTCTLVQHVIPALLKANGTTHGDPLALARAWREHVWASMSCLASATNIQGAIDKAGSSGTSVLDACVAQKRARAATYDASQTSS